MKLLFVVDHYQPYVQAIAQESLARGYDVSVFTNQHNGTLNGVKVTSDFKVVFEDYNLIIVHGGDCANQNMVHEMSHIITSPILYLLIVPSRTEICMKGLTNAKYIGCSTKEDWDHVKKNNVEHKSHSVRHGIIIPQETKLVESRFRSRFGITTKYIILSCGGFWRHKDMMELAETFNKSNRTDTTLVLICYHNDPNNKPTQFQNVVTLFLEDRQEISDALSTADLYIMNNHGEKNLLLEAMSKRVPWAARNNFSKELCDYGYIYQNNKELFEIISNLELYLSIRPGSYEYVKIECSIKNTVDDIENILKSNLK